MRMYLSKYCTGVGGEAWAAWAADLGSERGCRGGWGADEEQRGDSVAEWEKKEGRREGGRRRTRESVWERREGETGADCAVL